MKISKYILMSMAVLSLVNPLVAFADQNKSISENDISRKISETGDNDSNLNESIIENNDLPSSKSIDNKYTKVVGTRSTTEGISKIIPWNNTGLNLTLDADGKTLHVPSGVILNKNVSIIRSLRDSDIYAKSINKIIVDGPLSIEGSAASMFFSGEDNGFHLKEIIGLENLDTSKVTNMHEMFKSNHELTSIDVSGFDTSKVMDMSFMFDDDKAVTNLDVSKFDTSNVRNMANMFYRDDSLLSVDVGNFDTSNVTSIAGMFWGDKNISKLDVGNWDTSNVSGKGMEKTFYVDEKLENLDVSKWDTSKVTSLMMMFESDHLLNGLNVSNWDTSNVTDMDATFAGLNSLESLDVSKWDTSKVVYMEYLFMATGVMNLDLSKWDTSNVRFMYRMFEDDKNLNNIDVSHFNTSNVEDMSLMFDNCQNLKLLDFTNWNTLKVTDMGQMLRNTNDLHILKLGSKFKWVTALYGNARLPEHKESKMNTDKWVNLKDGTEKNPKGENIWSSDELMTKYDGSKDADTYIWQPKVVKGADVIVKYVDENGKTIQSNKVIDATDKILGDEYDASTADYKFDELTGIDGTKYMLDGSRLPDNAKGKFLDSEQTVIYVYNVKPETNTPTKPINPNTNMPTKPVNPRTNMPQVPANPNTNTPQMPANPGTNMPTRPANPNINMPTKPVNPRTNMPQVPANPKTNTPQLPANPETNIPTLPIIDGNGSNGGNDNNSNTNTNNDKSNDIVNNVVQLLLPKTAVKKVKLYGVVSVVLVSLAGLLVWKSIGKH